MSKDKISFQKLNGIRKTRDQSTLFYDNSDGQKTIADVEILKQILQEDPNIILLNNILMSVQFFENYERDVELLRENWYKEFHLESQHKKCFYADSLFRMIGVNVKFSPKYGENKNLEQDVLLSPCRIYVTSENVEAAFDSSVMSRTKVNTWPHYQFTVKANAKTEKSGYISLIEFKRIDAINSSKQQENAETQSKVPISCRKKSNFDLDKSVRRLTKTEKIIALQRKSINLKPSLKQIYVAEPKDNILSLNKANKIKYLEQLQKPGSILNFRMNCTPMTSHKIPKECFRKEEFITKVNTRRRTDLFGRFKTQNVLSSTAFKSYFSDLLLERLSDSLNLNLNAVHRGFVHEEFIAVNDQGIKYYITPVVPIQDWNEHVVINKSLKSLNDNKKLQWPSGLMQKIINILPCYAAPMGEVSERHFNEEIWKLTLPKAEEFLLLHLMHSQIRCYLYALLLYKSFIETEINPMSFGPKHLMHLLFWRVHKNFLAWPENRPGETLLIYLKILYKKLQNKNLKDFFITDRNLFANSFPKDLHKAQALIKKIIENPIPHLIKAIRNLKLEPSFYPSLDTLKLYTILTPPKEQNGLPKTLKEKKQKKNCFEDEEQEWQRRVLRKIELERKVEEEMPKLTMDSIDTKTILNFNSQDVTKSHQVLEIFIFHFIAMARKSIEYKFSSQTQFYLYETQNLFDLLQLKEYNNDQLNAARTEFNKLKSSFGSTIKQNQPKLYAKESKFQKPRGNHQKQESHKEKPKQMKVPEIKVTPHESNNEDDGIVTIKL